MSIRILIPAYKPDEKLIALVDELCASLPVIVVDDGSGNEYASLFRQIEQRGIPVLHHSTNRGKGAALKTGIRHLFERGGTTGIITADADGQHTRGDIMRMASAMEQNLDTLLLGGRDFSKMPPRSRFGNTMTRFFFRFSTGLRISDTQTGLRGLPACLFERLIALKGERYEYEMNMLLSLRDWHVPYKEIPIDTLYIENNRSSHFHALKDGWRVFSRVIRYALSSLGCTLADYAAYSLLLYAALPPAWSYACARTLSALCNYQLNCRVVFRGRSSWKSALRYALLVLFSMAVGSYCVSLLTGLGLGGVIAKLVVDFCLFFFNYFVQKHWIFSRPEGC